MELETVAEFVQDQATLDLLGKLGITWAQGYLVGEPRLLAELPVLAADQPAAQLIAQAPRPSPLSTGLGGRRRRTRLVD